MPGRTIVNKSLLLLLVLSLVLAACGGESPAATPVGGGGSEAEPTEIAQAEPTEPVIEPMEPVAGETATAPTTGETPMAEATAMPMMTATVPMPGETAEATEGAEPPADAGGLFGPGLTEQQVRGLRGRIQIDGSSTVLPISEAAAEDFRQYAPNVNVTVASSGTGGGFERFCTGETQISDASRPIGEDEIAVCEENGIEFIELPVALDGLAVVVNRENEFVECLTTEELQTIWQPEAEGQITTWNQVRESFPDEDLVLFGPGADSGTFDFFTEEINGEEGASRGDYTASEDDNVLVQGIAGEPYSLGYFGYAYYQQNQDTLKVLGVDAGEGCVTPSAETVNNGTYPLSRPLFIYVNAEEAQRNQALSAFVNFYLSPEFTPVVASEEIGYVELTDEQYQGVKARFNAGTTGSEAQEEFNIENYTGN